MIPPDHVVDTITGDVVKISDYTGTWFSASLIEDAQQCMAKAYGRITRQPQVNPGLALINGTAAHRGMELWMKERKDPIKVYNETFKMECEKQKLLWNTPEADDVRLAGEKMIAASKARFSENNFVDRVDPNLVEVKIRLMRNGRMFVAKLDLLQFMDEQRYVYVDLKTGKTPPKQYELDSDIQFNIYPWAAYNAVDLPTNGIWPERGVWFHMRGKNVGKEEVKHRDGTIGWQTAKKEQNKIWQFDFPTRPTPESVDQIFRDTIDPVCGDIEDGRWKRNRQDHCQWCGFFDKENEKCRVELPIDGLAERAVQIDLIDKVA